MNFSSTIIIGMVFQLFSLPTLLLSQAPLSVLTLKYLQSIFFPLRQLQTLTQYGQQSLPMITMLLDDMKLICLLLKVIYFMYTLFDYQYLTKGLSIGNLYLFLINFYSFLIDNQSINFIRKKQLRKESKKMSSDLTGGKDEKIQNVVDSQKAQQLSSLQKESTVVIDESQKDKKTLEKTQQQLKSAAKQIQKQKQVNNCQVQQQIQKELEQMQFQKEYIEQALTKCQTLDQAIEFIINKIENGQKQLQAKHLTQQVKVFFIVRMDLGMKPGKMAAQVGHASLKAFTNIRSQSNSDEKKVLLFVEWMSNGKKQVVLKGQSEQQLNKYMNQARSRGVNVCYIRDAGRTQIAAGSMTVAAIGPIKECQVPFMFELQEL